MRRLVTFIVRLWVDAKSDPTSCEGQVEYIATGERAHIRSEEEVLHFIHECIKPHHKAENPLNRDELSSGDS
jgi:hypothetical protein